MDIPAPDSTTKYVEPDSGKPTKDLFNWVKSISSGLAGLIDADAADRNAWTTYTPVISSGAGTFTTTSTAGRYKQIGKTVFVSINILITTVGTASGTLFVSLPVTASSLAFALLYGREAGTTGKMLQGICSPSSATAAVLNYDNSSPIIAGNMLLSGVYESA